MKITITPFNYPEDSDNYRGSTMSLPNQVAMVNSTEDFTKDLFLFLHHLKTNGIKIKPQTITLETLP